MRDLGPDRGVCRERSEGGACTTATSASGACHSGACVAIACGDARIDTGEVCDDGNTTSGDSCSSDCKSDETCGNGVVDPLKLTPTGPMLNEECDDGNRLSGDGCSSLCKLETPRWELLDTSGPAGLDGAALAYDPVRRRVVMFGGQTVDTSGREFAVDGTYEWDGNGWLKIPTTLAPNARRFARMIYHPGLRRIVMYGGLAGQLGDISVFHDVWLWDGDRWTLAGGDPPPGRANFGMVYDSARKVVVVFGGDASGTSDNSTWEWDGTTWRGMTTAHAPSIRDSFGMAYDPKRGRVVLVGGQCFSNYNSNSTTGCAPGTGTAPSGQITYSDTWEYDGTDWHQVTTATPPAIDDGSLAYDPSSGMLIAYDGSSGTPTTWSYNGTNWTNLVAPLSMAAGRTQFQLATDLERGNVVMYGGLQNTGGPPQLLGDTWWWSGGAWHPLPAAPVSTSPFQMATAYDPLSGLGWWFGGMHVALGGNDQSGVATNELWSFDGTSWTLHQVTGGPAARANASMAYDAMNRAIVLFGGVSDSTNNIPLLPNETWLWDGASWRNAHPAHSPPSREAAAMTYDPTRGRVVLFGGEAGGSGTINGLSDLWEWDGTDWTEITAASGPNARAGVLTGYMPKLGVLFGFGLDAAPPANPFATDLWSWDGTSWTQRQTDAPLPLRAFPSTMVPLPRAHAVVFGGFTLNNSAYDDTWEWDGTSWSQIATQARPGPRFGNGAMFDRNGGDVLIFGGTSGSESGPFYPDTWRLRYDSDAPREQCELDVDNDGDGLSGCADPDCWTTCTPVCPPGLPCDASAPKCGDGVCNSALENCRNCPGDCACSPVCGDTYCEGNETHTSCPGDCP